jgi:patatin-related protein
MPTDATSNPAELRLALVCYGGVSLAVYMHGMTKEIHKLVRASRAFDDVGPIGENPFEEDDESEYAYFEALRAVARAGHQLTVVVDVIAGTSAGGINGVCLAKVLATNGSQEPLKRLWIDEGDLQKLLNAPPIGGWKVKAAYALVHQLLNLDEPGGVLHGENMTRLLHEAIHGMDTPQPGATHDGSTRATLLPAGGGVELHVTATDLRGFPVVVPTGAGGVSQRETDHTQVLLFRQNDVDEGLGKDSNDALTFAARATASFPGAFAPLSLSSFEEELEVHVDKARIASTFQNVYEGPPGAPLDEAWFVDGGVLDNAPFDHAVAAIVRKPAESEVRRRLVYLQPDPGAALSADTVGEKRDSKAPGYAQALGEVLSVKGSHSVLPELVKLRDMNIRIAQVSAITKAQGALVMQAIEQMWALVAPTTVKASSGDHAWNLDSLADASKLTHAFYSKGDYLTGAHFETYERLKVDEVAGRFAEELAQRLRYPPTSGRATFLRAATAEAARLQFDKGRKAQRVAKLLGPLDVPFRERRLLFILAGINEMYPAADQKGAPKRADLDSLKAAAWSLLIGLRQATAEAVREIPRSESAFVGPERISAVMYRNPAEFVRDGQVGAAFGTLYDSYRARLSVTMKDSSKPMWEAFQTCTAAWTDKYRKRLLSRFLGFPLWDSLIFPTTALAQLPQYTPVGVSQFSPLEATALKPVEKGKLRGITLAHFGAFLEAEWRENDYLWGRLDAAELLLGLIAETTSPNPGGPHPQLKRALSSILASESDLNEVKDLRKHLLQQVTQLP